MVYYIVISVFKFTLPPKLASSVYPNANQGTTEDEDGDLLVFRKDSTPDFHLSISRQFAIKLKLSNCYKLMCPICL